MTENRWDGPTTANPTHGHRGGYWPPTVQPADEPAEIRPRDYSGNETTVTGYWDAPIPASRRSAAREPYINAERRHERRNPREGSDTVIEPAGRPENVIGAREPWTRRDTLMSAIIAIGIILIILAGIMDYYLVMLGDALWGG